MLNKIKRLLFPYCYDDIGYMDQVAKLEEVTATIVEFTGGVKEVNQMMIR